MVSDGLFFRRYKGEGGGGKEFLNFDLEIVIGRFCFIVFYRRYYNIK